jgi:hypothetical protein
VRGSLASATSLLALLAVEGREAAANPIVQVGAAPPSYYALGSSRDAGTGTPGPVAATENYAFTPLTTGAASTTSGYTGSTPYFVVDQSSLAKLTTSGTPTPNTNDSNLTSLRRTGRPAGTVSASNSVFVGTSGSMGLLDSVSGLRSAASASFGYNFLPTAKGTATARAVTDPAGSHDLDKHDDSPATSASFVTQAQSTTPEPAAALPRMATSGAPMVTIAKSSNGTPAGYPMPDDPNGAISPPRGSKTANGRNPGAAGLKPTATAALGYIYNPLGHGTPTSTATTGFVHATSGGSGVSQPATSTPKGAPGERMFSGSVPGASVFATANPAVNRSAGRAPPRTPSNLRHDEAVKAFYLVLQRAASDANRGDSALANPTAEGDATDSADASSFSISSPPDGPAIARGATVRVPIVVVGTSNGELPSSLTIFTAESAASDGEGDSFNFFLDRGVVR